MIVWLASYPKSGNTWLRAFITSLLSKSTGENSLENMRAVRAYPLTDDFYNLLDDFSDFKKIAKNWETSQDIINLQKKIKILKTHHQLCKIDNFLFTNYKNSLATIYVVRDPRNVITSMCHHYSFNQDYALEKMLDHNASLSEKASNGDCSNFTYLGAWSEHYKSWKNNKKFKVLFIKYEDLNDKKEEIFEKIINFIEELKSNKEKHIDENKFINSIRSTNFVNLKNKELNEGFEESYISKEGKKINFFNMGFKNKWENLLPQDIIDKINQKFDKELKELGYK